MKKRVILLIIFGILLIILSIILVIHLNKGNNQEEKETSEIANPASAYCVNQGHFVEIRDEEDGQVGYCITLNRQECEEWAYYRGECDFEGYQRCVSASCCHPDSCILSNETSANCTGTLCTMECVSGTMDCGAGECAFVNGNCEVVWNEE